MRNYQKILLNSLQRNHWSLDELLKPKHWWEADIWVISSTRQQHGLQLFVTFIVDPGILRPHDLSCVWEITITQERLSNWNMPGALVSLHQKRQSYPLDIEAAMLRLHEFRNNFKNATKDDAATADG